MYRVKKAIEMLNKFLDDTLSQYSNYVYCDKCIKIVKTEKRFRGWRVMPVLTTLKCRNCRMVGSYILTLKDRTFRK